MYEWVEHTSELELVVRAADERAVLDETSLDATVEGRIGDPPALVKAATYHRLEFGPEGDGWRARVVLDV